MYRHLRDKLDCFLKSAHYNISDEALTAAIMAKNNDMSTNNIKSVGVSGK